MRIQTTPFGSHPFKRGVAIITVALFLLTQLSSYAPSAFAQSSSFKVQGGNPSGLFRLDRESEIRIPPELGLIDESFRGTSGKTILYIQDAHDSLEAQENIAKIINHLVSGYGVRTVFEEGYEGPVPTDRYFGFIKDQKIKEKVSWFFMDHLRLGGAEYAHINRTKDFNLIGADSLKLHKENIEQYRLSAEKKEAVTKDLKALEKEFHSLADSRFPKQLKEWIKVKEQFDAKKLDLVTYLGRTMPLLGRHGVEKNLGLIRFLIEAMKTNDPAVIEKAKHIDAREVFGELVKLEETVRETCLKDATDKKLFEYYKILSLLDRLNDLQVSQEEYETVQASLKAFDTESFAQFIFSQAPKTLILSRMWERNIKDAIKFYEIAQERDHSISEMLNQYSVGNIKKEELTSKYDVSVLVFGGFHKESIKRILEAQGISYLVVSPRITKPSPRHEQFYKRLMTDGKLSFELPANIRTAVRAESRIVDWNANSDLAKAEFRTLMPIAEKISNREDFSLAAEQAMKAFRSEVRTKNPRLPAGLQAMTAQSNRRALFEAMTMTSMEEAEAYLKAMHIYHLMPQWVLPMPAEHQYRLEMGSEFLVQLGLTEVEARNLFSVFSVPTPTIDRNPELKMKARIAFSSRSGHRAVLFPVKNGLVVDEHTFRLVQVRGVGIAEYARAIGYYDSRDTVLFNRTVGQSMGELDRGSVQGDNVRKQDSGLARKRTMVQQEMPASKKLWDIPELRPMLARDIMLFDVQGYLDAQGRYIPLSDVTKQREYHEPNPKDGTAAVVTIHHSTLPRFEEVIGSWSDENNADLHRIQGYPDNRTDLKKKEWLSIWGQLTRTSAFQQGGDIAGAKTFFPLFLAKVVAGLINHRLDSAQLSLQNLKPDELADFHHLHDPIQFEQDVKGRSDFQRDIQLPVGELIQKQEFLMAYVKEHNLSTEEFFWFAYLFIGDMRWAAVRIQDWAEFIQSHVGFQFLGASKKTDLKRYDVDLKQNYQAIRRFYLEKLFASLTEETKTNLFYFMADFRLYVQWRGRTRNGELPSYLQFNLDGREDTRVLTALADHFGLPELASPKIDRDKIPELRQRLSERKKELLQPPPAPNSSPKQTARDETRVSLVSARKKVGSVTNFGGRSEMREQDSVPPKAKRHMIGTVDYDPKRPTILVHIDGIPDTESLYGFLGPSGMMRNAYYSLKELIHRTGRSANLLLYTEKDLAELSDDSKEMRSLTTQFGSDFSCVDREFLTKIQPPQKRILVFYMQDNPPDLSRDYGWSSHDQAKFIQVSRIGMVQDYHSLRLEPSMAEWASTKGSESGLKPNGEWIFPADFPAIMHDFTSQGLEATKKRLVHAAIRGSRELEPMSDKMESRTMGISYAVQPYALTFYLYTAGMLMADDERAFPNGITILRPMNKFLRDGGLSQLGRFRQGGGFVSDGWPEETAVYGFLNGRFSEERKKGRRAPRIIVADPTGLLKAGPLVLIEGPEGKKRTAVEKLERNDIVVLLSAPLEARDFMMAMLVSGTETGPYRLPPLMTGENSFIQARCVRAATGISVLHDSWVGHFDRARQPNEYMDVMKMFIEDELAAEFFIKSFYLRLREPFDHVLEDFKPQHFKSLFLTGGSSVNPAGYEALRQQHDIFLRDEQMQEMEEAIRNDTPMDKSGFNINPSRDGFFMLPMALAVRNAWVYAAKIVGLTGLGAAVLSAAAPLSLTLLGGAALLRLSAMLWSTIINSFWQELRRRYSIIGLPILDQNRFFDDHRSTNLRAALELAFFVDLTDPQLTPLWKGLWNHAKPNFFKEVGLRRSEVRKSTVKLPQSEISMNSSAVVPTPVIIARLSLAENQTSSRAEVRVQSVSPVVKQTVLVIEDEQIAQMTQDNFLKLLGLVGTRRSEIRLVIPDAGQGHQYSDRAAALRSVTKVLSRLPEAMPKKMSVFGFSGGDDTAKALRTRLRKSDPRIPTDLKCFVLDGDGIVLALLVNQPEEVLQRNKNDFFYDGTGRFRSEVRAFVETLVQNYVVISKAA